VVSNKDCKSRLWIWLSKRGKDHDGKYRKIHLSNYAFYRKCTSIITILLLYFLAFFIPYMIGFYNLITSTRLFFPATLNILGQNHKFIITNYEVFQSAVNSLGTITSTTQVTNTLKCILDDKSKPIINVRSLLLVFKAYFSSLVYIFNGFANSNE